MRNSTKQLTNKLSLSKLAFSYVLSIAAVALMAFGLLGLYQTSHTKAHANTVVHSNSFEDADDLSHWNQGGTYGTISRVASGANGITSASGDYHAVVSSSDASGPYTPFDGYSSVWPNDWSASVDVYIDPTWDADSAFLYVVASNNVNGTYLMDYTMHGGVLNDESTGYTNKFFLLADTVGAPQDDPLFHIREFDKTKRAEVTTAGWYTIKHHFKNHNGILVVDLEVLNSNGGLVGSWHIDYEDWRHPIPEVVGGNRYGWFTHATMDGGLAIDNVSRSINNNAYSVSPEIDNPVNAILKENETLTLLGVENGEYTSPTDIQIKSQTNNVEILIPENTKIEGDSTWSGIINAPSLRNTESVELSGEELNVSKAVKVGTSTPLYFSQPVKILLPGQAGQAVGYLDHDDNFRQITEVCSSEVMTSLPENASDCYIEVDQDIVIWTNHFSTFVSFDPPAATSGLNGTGIGAPNTGVGRASLLPATIALLAGITLLTGTWLHHKRRTQKTYKANRG